MNMISIIEPIKNWFAWTVASIKCKVEDAMPQQELPGYHLHGYDSALRDWADKEAQVFRENHGRNLRYLTQAESAERLGIAVSTFNKYVRAGTIKLHGIRTSDGVKFSPAQVNMEAERRDAMKKLTRAAIGPKRRVKQRMAKAALASKES